MKGITKYQLEILNKVRDVERDTGRLADFDQVLESLSWAPTKDAAQFTIRAVIAKGFIEKAPLEQRRGRKRVCYQMTKSGKLVLDPRGVPPGEAKVSIFVPGIDDSDLDGMEILEH